MKKSFSIARKTAALALCFLCLSPGEPLFSLEILNPTLPAGAATPSGGPVEFVAVGEPVIASGAGTISGLGFAYTVPPKAAVLKFVDTPSVLAAGGGALVSAEALDSGGRPVQNLEVRFSRLSGAGFLETNSSRTGPDGKAVVVFRSSGTAINAIEARVRNLPPVSKRVLSLSVPNGTLTGLSTTDNGASPHVLTLGNKRAYTGGGEFSRDFFRHHPPGRRRAPRGVKPRRSRAS